MAQGTIHKRCGCTYVGDDGKRKQYGRACPKLRRPGGAWSPNHGTWGFSLGVTSSDGVRKLRTGGGYATKDEAVQALDALKAKASRGVDITTRPTVGE